MTSRDIPDRVKRIVRQASHFGCVICGMPIYHYDHIEEFAAVQEHHPDNMVLLCPNHHQDKSSGRVDKEYVRRFQKEPRNAGRDKSAPYSVLMAGEHGTLIVGSNRSEFTFPPDGGRFDAIVIRGESVLGLETQDGHLLLDLKLTDHEGRTILEAVRGELMVSTGVWDYSFEGKMLCINSGPRKVEIQIELGPKVVEVRRGRFVRLPLTLEVFPDRMKILPANVTLSGNVSLNCRVGVLVN